MGRCWPLGGEDFRRAASRPRGSNIVTLHSEPKWSNGHKTVFPPSSESGALRHTMAAPKPALPPASWPQEDRWVHECGACSSTPVCRVGSSCWNSHPLLRCDSIYRIVPASAAIRGGAATGARTAGAAQKTPRAPARIGHAAAHQGKWAMLESRSPRPRGTLAVEQQHLRTRAALPRQYKSTHIYEHTQGEQVLGANNVHAGATTQWLPRQPRNLARMGEDDTLLRLLRDTEARHAHMGSGGTAAGRGDNTHIHTSPGRTLWQKDSASFPGSHRESMSKPCQSMPRCGPYPSRTILCDSPCVGIPIYVWNAWTHAPVLSQARISPTDLIEAATAAMTQ